VCRSLSLDFRSYSRARVRDCGLLLRLMREFAHWPRAVARADVLKVSTFKLGSPIIMLIGIKPLDSLSHKHLPKGRYARIMMSTILNFVAALTA
jgi:hypothetical protein